MSQPGDGNFNDTNNSSSQNSSSDVSGGSQQPANSSQNTTNWETEYKRLEASYNGLKGHVKQVTEQRDKLSGQVSDLQLQIEARKSEYEIELQKITKSSTEAASKLGELQGKVDKYERHDALRTTIRTNHPELLADFEDGLLRLDGLEGDALNDYLGKYAERMSARQTDAIKGSMKGATPPAPRGSDSAAKSVEELRQEVMKTAPGSDEYRTAWAAYKQALAEQK